MGMMPMPTAYLDNLIGKTVMSTQFQIQIALMVYKSLNDLVPGYLSSILKFVKEGLNGVVALTVIG